METSGFPTASIPFSRRCATTASTALAMPATRYACPVNMKCSILPCMEDPNNVQKTALAVTRWVGSPASIITHSILFAAAFASVFTGLLHFDRMLLILTTIVSLEAIYLAIFIQMTLNYTTETIEEVEKDIDEIQGDIDEMQEDVEEIQEDVDEIQEDVEDISEDVDEMTEEEKADVKDEEQQKKTLSDIQNDLRKLMQDIEKLQQK